MASEAAYVSAISAQPDTGSDQNEYLALYRKTMAEVRSFGWTTPENYIDIPTGRCVEHGHECARAPLVCCILGYDYVVEVNAYSP